MPNVREETALAFTKEITSSMLANHHNRYKVSKMNNVVGNITRKAILLTQ